MSKAADTPSAGQLLVRVRAAGLNRADLLDLQRAPGAAVGRELAGDVVAVGDGVSGWAVGDRIMSRGAGFAREATVPARHAMPVPSSLTWEEAGALPVALMTMHDALVTNGRFRSGDRVLVHAATSGVGVAGVQLAALLGASVAFATSRSAAKLDVLRDYLGDLGACELVTIDTTAIAFESVADDVNVIVDNVGASVLAGNVEAVSIGGRIVQVGRLGGATAEIDLEEVARKRLGLVGVTFRTRTDDDVAEIVRHVIDDVGSQLERVRPRVERTYPLDHLATAFDDLASNQHVGKLVVIP